MSEYKNNNEGYELDWDEEISNDGSGEYVLLEEGDYNYVVTKFERGRFPGGAKIPECKKVTLTLTVETNEGQANVRYDMILWSSLRFKICDFCISIGQARREDEAIKPNWSSMIGSRGRARFKPREYTDKKSGEKRQVNDVARFYDYDPKFFQASAPAAQSAKPVRSAAPAWQAGKF